MTVYQEVKSFLDAESLQKKKTTNDLLKMPKTNFKEILELYIKVASILKGQWIRDIKIPDETWFKQSEFLDRDFNYIILSKGNNIVNELILTATIMKCAIMLEKYISSKLISKNPQFEYFTQFQLGNYEGLEYVFNRNIFNEDIIFSYKTKDGTKKNIESKADYLSFNKEIIEEIQDGIEISDKVIALLTRLKTGLFAKYKKFVIIAAEESFKGNNLEENGEFMLELNKVLIEQKLN